MWRSLLVLKLVTIVMAEITIWKEKYLVCLMQNYCINLCIVYRETRWAYRLKNTGFEDFKFEFNQFTNFSQNHRNRKSGSRLGGAQCHAIDGDGPP